MPGMGGAIPMGSVGANTMVNHLFYVIINLTNKQMQSIFGHVAPQISNLVFVNG